MSTILITGGAGFIGSHLVERLLEAKNEVVCLDDFNDFYDQAIKRKNIKQSLDLQSYTLVEEDIRNQEAVEALFRKHEFQEVIHLAARAGVRPSLQQPELYYTVNVNGTLNLLEASRKHGVQKFIFGSSSSVYGINSSVPFCEDDQINRQISPYGATKAAGELLCHVYSHLYNIKIVCLRFFTVYGARQRPDLAIHKFARLISEGKPIPIFGEGTSKRDYTYVDDIIQGILKSMHDRQENFEIFNLGESQTVELNYLISLIEQAMGKKARRETHPLQPGDVPITYADLSRSRKVLGYNPETPIEAGIPKFIQWFEKMLHGEGAA